MQFLQGLGSALLSLSPKPFTWQQDWESWLAGRSLCLSDMCGSALKVDQDCSELSSAFAMVADCKFNQLRGLLVGWLVLPFHLPCMLLPTLLLAFDNARSTLACGALRASTCSAAGSLGPSRVSSK
jgi:hypothetical protein